ncbi:MAG: hypothetical protein MZV64_24040 [Ignavibacteriales bacterium]|nr:hypothetical protein [Ignavibacteriales bacterium]
MSMRWCRGIRGTSQDTRPHPSTYRSISNPRQRWLNTPVHCPGSVAGQVCTGWSYRDDPGMMSNVPASRKPCCRQDLRGCDLVHTDLEPVRHSRKPVSGLGIIQDRIAVHSWGRFSSRLNRLCGDFLCDEVRQRCGRGRGNGVTVGSGLSGKRCVCVMDISAQE